MAQILATGWLDVAWGCHEVAVLFATQWRFYCHKVASESNIGPYLDEYTVEGGASAQAQRGCMFLGSRIV